MDTKDFVWLPANPDHLTLSQNRLLRGKRMDVSTTNVFGCTLCCCVHALALNISLTHLSSIYYILCNGFALCNMFTTVLTLSANQRRTGTCGTTAMFTVLSKAGPVRSLALAAELLWTGKTSYLDEEPCAYIYDLSRGVQALIPVLLWRRCVERIQLVIARTTIMDMQMLQVM